jgi:GTPase SAR1 family protein
MARCKASILLYGDSGDGKTALIGELAEYLFRTERKVTRLYNADPGGWATIQPYVNLGIIELIDCLAIPQPWEWLDAISRGKVPTRNEQRARATGLDPGHGT